MLKQKKKRIFDIIQIGQRADFPSRFFDIFIVVVIVLNILVMFLETFTIFDSCKGIFHTIEMVTVLIFMAEYLLRIWTCEYLYPDMSRKRALLRFLTSFDGIVDLLTILPFFFLTGFVVFRMLRVVRIFHLFRINATYDSFNVITSVIYEKRNQIISSVFIILILMMSSSLCMYSAEHEAQPDVFNNAFSGMWWSISTILTVGYGDIYPITVLGRLMAIVIALLGVGVVAIPTGIISAGFVEQYTSLQDYVLVTGSQQGKGSTILGKMHVYDISRGIFETPVYPGDPKPAAKEWFSVQKGDPCNLHVLTMGTHSGTHIDAPAHFLPDGSSVDDIPLEKMVGFCVVATCPGAHKKKGGSQELSARELKQILPPHCRKLLVRGNAVLTPDGAWYLAERGVELFGTELAGVGDETTGPEIHRTLLHAQVVILENLVLDGVMDGSYQIFAQPLKMEGMDGSPVRAILMGDA